MLLTAVATAAPVWAEDPAEPYVRALAATFLAGHHHDFFVESELRVPVLTLSPATTYFHYRESTPFLHATTGAQAETLYRQHDLQVDFRLNDDLRLISLAGYRSSDREDAPGNVSAVALGGGIGSPLRADGGKLHWSALAGGYTAQRNLAAGWWTDARGAWRVYEFYRDRYMGTEFTASVDLLAEMEAVNDDARFHALYRFGPSLQLLTATGNRCAFQLLWFHNDGNPFFGGNENGLLLGLEINSSLTTNYVFHARDRRQGGWFPLVWGAYDIGAGLSRLVNRFEINSELFDFPLRDQPATIGVWYESRQEYRAGDFDNIAYSVALGVQTPLPWTSPLPPDQPLVVGVDYLHRSDHALNPGADRVPPGTVLDHGNHNLLPRLRLQTRGWDLPYRDPDIYRVRTAWLHHLDWRVTAGFDVLDNRSRGRFAGQWGLNWDIATLEGHVVYARGLVSAGNETPDWLLECGLRRREGKLFTRFERYGIRSELAHGDALLIGVGVNL